MKIEKSEIFLKGMPISPGLVIGEAIVWRHRNYVPVRRHIRDRKLRQQELENFHRARERMLEGLKTLKGNLPDYISQLIDYQILILNDREFIKDVEYLVLEKGSSAEAAVHEIIDRKVQKMLSHDHPMVQDRGKELKMFFSDFLSYLRNEERREAINRGNSILFADDITLEETIRIINAGIKAVVLEGGGKTSHAAIILRDYKVPAVFGVGRLMQKVKDGDRAIVNAWKGEVIVNPREETLERYYTIIEWYLKQEKDFNEVKKLRAITTDGKAITVMANIELPDETDLVKENGAQGIGLFRTEVLTFRESEEEENQVRIYSKVCEGVYPFPCVIRAFDLGGDKGAQLMGVKSTNTFLGLRGIRLLLKEQSRFRRQIRAILRANIKGNIRFMIPMVSVVEEIQEARRIIEEEAKKLADRGIEFKIPDFGIMVEVPSIVLILESAAPYLDFVSIGTNDLTQYTLAVDRKDEEVAYLFQHYHPAILKLIEKVVKVGQTNGIRVSVCGELASDPIGVVLLVGLGITELSLTPSLIPDIKHLIRHISFEEAEVISQRALKLATAEEVYNLVHEFIKNKDPQLLSRHEGDIPENK